MSLDVTGAKNFYYYGKPSDQVPNPPYPPGQKITTQLPANVAKIRIGVILALTAYVSYKIYKVTGSIVWCWPLVVLGVTLAAYVAYQHLLKKDPLIEAFYKIAGGKENYEKLPQIPIEKNKKTYESFKMAWASLEHPAYGFTISDGRKGMLIKGLSDFKERGIEEALIGVGPTATEALMIFVEKLGPYDVPRIILNEAEWATSILTAFDYKALDNPFTHFLKSSLWGSPDEAGAGSKKRFDIYAWISTDMANEFIAQRGIVNQLAPEGPKVEEVKE
jgi:hypothetical protein